MTRPRKPGREHSPDRVLLKMAARLKWLCGALCPCLAVVVGAYWHHQIVRAEHYERLAENNRLRVLRLDAPRGLIHDRSGRILVENTPTFRLMIDRSRSADPDASLAFAAEVLGREERELRVALERHRGVAREVPVLLAEDLDLTQVARFEVSKEPEHPEFEISASRRRLYRHGFQTAHVVGHLGEPTPAEVDRDDSLAAGDLVGRGGVELVRDRRLRGRHGERRVVVDSRGRMVGEDLRRTDARAGESVTLTIDLPLQQLAENLLADRVGAIVALDPRDGAIRAMVSSPSFDPNDFGGRLSQQDWDRIVDAPGKPLQNRAIQNSYPPGSVFKIVMAVAGLAEGLLRPEERIHCGGATRLYNRRWRCWQSRGHGLVDLRGALQHSCDIYFYRQGTRIGIETIAAWARRLGLGKRTGVELPGESEGLVPDPEWSRKRRGHPWYPGETVSVAIGQGPLLASPLQVAVMTAAVANGGSRVRPYLIAGGGAAPAPLGLDGEVVSFVAEALAHVVENGTGRNARTPAVAVAGKTGTAQVVAQATWIRSEDLPPDQADHAWFASWAPVEAAELVVVVFVENGGRGSEEAAPLAREMHEGYFSAADKT